MSTIYEVKETDQRHKCRGLYLDVSGSFELPIGPWPSIGEAKSWVEHNADRLRELYGDEATRVTFNLSKQP